MDQLGFVLGAMRERTETHWRNILDREEYKTVQIHSYELGSESLIEAEFA